VPRLFLAICAISFFWMIGAVLVIEFPPLVKNIFTGDKQVASLFLAIFSVGVALGSVLVNRLLAGCVSARFAPASVIAMGGFVLLMAVCAQGWDAAGPGQLYSLIEFVHQPRAPMLGVALLGVALSGGMFVVPLYAFLTTAVEADHTARTVAANNIVNSGAMVIGSLGAMALATAGVSVIQALWFVAAMCMVAAWIAWRLHLACTGCVEVGAASG
jgi:hypothetical protein